MATNERFPTVGFHVPQDQSLRKSIQRLRWFKSTFDEQVEAASIRTGITYDVNSQILTKSFLEWLRQFEEAKPKNPDHRYAYVGYTAGKMLKHLILRNPLKVVELPKQADKALPEYFWPEGFVYVSYCLNIRQSVLKQDFNADLEPAAELNDIRTWWSFKENVADLPDYAMAFLDLFAGENPNWEAPGLFNGAAQNSEISGDMKVKIKP